MGTISKIVIDANVFISAFGWDGKPEAVLRFLEQQHILNYTTDDIYDELRRVVTYPKLKFSASLQAKILEFGFCWSTVYRIPALRPCRCGFRPWSIAFFQSQFFPCSTSVKFNLLNNFYM
ncbi:MAG: putative toxin-antitoxin system toxin component, PIN family [Syntrophales bacterium]|jgi:hypothetical protein|nr:putative toxin-antitoxin system toxin component, PIN family [Syntrophales bacterium]